MRTTGRRTHRDECNENNDFCFIVDYEHHLHGEAELLALALRQAYDCPAVACAAQPIYSVTSDGAGNVAAIVGGVIAAIALTKPPKRAIQC